MRIKLTDPFSPLFANLLSALMLIPEHVWKDVSGKVDVDDPLNYPEPETG
ncbi:MAG: hypothetical protein R3E87_11120 [Burkholderiaceae bacterium]